MKKKIIFFASIVLGLIIMGAIYLSIDDILKPFTGAPLILLIPYSFVVILIHIVHSWRWNIILKTMGHRVALQKLFVFRLIGYSINYITPTAHIGGEPVKAAMLKESDVSYTDGVSSIFIDKSFEVFADGLMSIFGILIMTLSFAMPRELWSSFIVLSLICLIFLFRVLFRLTRQKKPLYSVFKAARLDRIAFLRTFKGIIEKTDDNINNFFVSHKKHFWKCLILSGLMWILMFVEYKLLLLMLGFDASLIQLFVIISFVGLAYFIPIPAALGVLEAGQISAFKILSLNTSMGMATSIVIRAKDTIFSITGLLLLSIKGMRYKENN